MNEILWKINVSLYVYVCVYVRMYVCVCTSHYTKHSCQVGLMLVQHMGVSCTSGLCVGSTAAEQALHLVPRGVSLSRQFSWVMQGSHHKRELWTHTPLRSFSHQPSSTQQWPLTKPPSSSHHYMYCTSSDWYDWCQVFSWPHESIFLIEK